MKKLSIFLFLTLIWFTYTLSAQSGPITINYTASSPYSCIGDTVYFTDLSTSIPAIIARKWTFKGGIPTTSALQNPKVVFPFQGKYDVILEVDNGINKLTEGNLAMIVVSECTGIKEKSIFQVMVYPNPAHNTFQITGIENAEYTLFSSIGSQLKKGLIKNEEITSVNIETLPQGFYLLTIYKANQQKSIKIVKE